MAGHRIDHERAAAFVGHVLPIDIAAFAEQGHGQVAQAARTDAAVVDVFLGFSGSHHITKTFVLRARKGGQHHGRGADERDRSQVFARVKRQSRDQAGVDAVGVKNHRKGVAIRGRGSDRRRADRAGRAALVLDDDVLTELLRQRHSQNACHLIDRATGRKHRHELDRLARPGGLRPGGRCSSQRRTDTGHASGGLGGLQNPVFHHDVGL